MKIIDRRNAIAVGVAATTMAFMSESARAQPNKAGAGKKIAPGVRAVQLGKRASNIPSYKTISVVDAVFQPKAKLTAPSAASDMLCFCAEGELRVNQGPGKEFVAKKGDVWSCHKGQFESDENIGTGVAIMRVTYLLSA